MPKTSEVTEVVERDLKRFSEQIHQELQAIRKQLHESISSRFDKIDGSDLNLLFSVYNLSADEYWALQDHRDGYILLPHTDTPMTRSARLPH